VCRVTTNADQVQDTTAFGLGNYARTLGRDPLSDRRGELGSGNNDGFGGGGYNRLPSDDDEPPRSWSVLSLCIRSCNVVGTKIN
jgi:hypothetical protein